jgi:hypothetical protein
MKRPRFFLEHASSNYLVIEWATRRVVASYPYSSELRRGDAYNKAKWDTAERNAAAENHESQGKSNA